MKLRTKLRTRGGASIAITVLRAIGQALADTAIPSLGTTMFGIGIGTVAAERMKRIDMRPIEPASIIIARRGTAAARGEEIGVTPLAARGRRRYPPLPQCPFLPHRSATSPSSRASE